MMLLTQGATIDELAMSVGVPRCQQEAKLSLAWPTVSQQTMI